MVLPVPVLTNACKRRFLGFMPPATTRRISLNQLFAYNQPVVWQLAVALGFAVLTLSFATGGLPFVAILAGMLSALAFLVAGMNIRSLWTEDFYLLRRGLVVTARIREPVPDAKQSLYRITYQIPDTPGEHSGVFRAHDGAELKVAEPVLILVDPLRPERFLEATGRYEGLL